MNFAIKMLLDYTYGLLNLLEVKYNHFDRLFLAESEFQNSNVGGKNDQAQASHKTSWSGWHLTKGGASWELVWGHEFKLFAANIWIFKFWFC